MHIHQVLSKETQVNGLTQTPLCKHKMKHSYYRPFKFNTIFCFYGYGTKSSPEDTLTDISRYE
jgi:hypothetical protein